MDPDLTISTSHVNGTAAHIRPSAIVAWMLLPYRIQASRFQMSHLRAPQGASASQVSLDYSQATAVSQTLSPGISKNSMSFSAESNQQASSREQACVVRPTFSLADSHEGAHKLQNMNVPETIFNVSPKFTPVISSVQTLCPNNISANSISGSGPKVVSTQEPQICIGSVFNLDDKHIEHHTAQHETKNEVSHVAKDNSASPQTSPERRALPQVYQQNKTEKEHDTVSPQFCTTLSTIQNQYSGICSALNSPVCLTSSLLRNSKNNMHKPNILLHATTTSKNSVSVEVSSPKDNSQLLLGCTASIPRSAAYEQSTSAVTSDAQLPVSQKNGSIIKAEKKITHMLRGEETLEKPASLTEPEESSSTTQMLPFTSKVPKTEIVDLDIDDDDCMLVKVELSMYHFPYGIKIHDSEVVIDDSDNDEGETSSGMCGEQKSCATFTVVMGENDACGTTGSLSKEVKEVNSEASKTKSKPAVAYTMSSPGQTHVTSVMGTRTKTQPLSDQIYSEGSCSTRHTAGIDYPEYEVIDLQDDESDDAPTSDVEYMSLTASKPSKPDTNVSTAVTQSVFSSSSLLSSSLDIPALKESYCNPFLESAVHGQITKNALRGSEHGVRKDHISQAIYSSKVAPTVPRCRSHDLQTDGPTGKITNSNSSLKASPKGEAIKTTTPAPKRKSAENFTFNIKIPSTARTQKKSPSHSDIASKTVESTLSAKTDRSVVCKLCSKSFSSRMKLVTHTWNQHRGLYLVENNLKCDACGECFANNSSLELHKKDTCSSSKASDVDPLDSVWHNLLKKKRVSRLPKVCPSSATYGGVVIPQPSTAGLSSGRAVIDTSNSIHVDVPIVLNSFPQRNEVISNYSAGVVTESASGKHPDIATGEKSVSKELMQEDVTPVNTSTCELLQRSDGPNQVLAGGLSVDNGHKCISCQKTFSNSARLSLHHQVSEGCKVARNDCFQCIVCVKTFTSSIMRYLHVLNNPECKEKVDRYCSKCSRLFNSIADKQGHLSIFKACRIYEECRMKDVVKNLLAKNVAHVEQNVTEPGNQLRPAFNVCEISQPDKSPALAQANNNSRQVADTSAPNSVLYPVSVPSQINPAGKSHSEKPKGGEAMKQKPYVQAKSSAMCPACKKKFATSAVLVIHFNESPKCRRKICSASKFAPQKSASYVAKKISVSEVAKKKYALYVAKKISASEVAKKISASEVAKKISASEVTKRISASEVAKKISASEVAKKISASVFAKTICASDRVNIPKLVATPKSPPRASSGNVINSSSTAVSASGNVFCDMSSADRSLKCKVCGAEFISENELTHHTEHKCRNLQNSKAVPRLKNLRNDLSCVSVMCQVCHLPFADDIRLAEHLHLNQLCWKGTSERINRVLELKKSFVDIDTLKRDGKRRSCEIVTDINSVTSVISAESAQDDCIALAEYMPAVDSVINEKLSTGNGGHISSNSSAKKQYVCDQGNANGDSKGHADDSDKDELISSMSSSDDGSDMEDSGSSSEEGNRDYTCKQCCQTYASKSLLFKHNKSHHQSMHSKKARCKVCTRKFHDLTGFQAHLLQFKFCFIPLTRPLWKRKQDPQICSMCKKVVGNLKDLQKHCFKKMACRLRYINLVLKNMKGKDHASDPPGAEAEAPVLKAAKETENTKVVPAAEVELPVSKAGKEASENQSANEVSSSVPGYCSPIEVDSSSSDMDIEDEISCIKISNVVSKPLIECSNCRGIFDDFRGHLLKQQSCLDFFSVRANI